MSDSSAGPMAFLFLIFICYMCWWQAGENYISDWDVARQCWMLLDGSGPDVDANETIRHTCLY